MKKSFEFWVLSYELRKRKVFSFFNSKLIIHNSKLAGAGALILALFLLASGAAWAQDAPDAAADAYGRGKAHAAKHEWDAAIAAYEEAARLYAEAEDRKGEAEAFWGVGTVYYYQSDFGKALELFEKALALREEIGDKRGIAASLNSIGIAHRALGDYVQALAFYEKSLHVTEEIGDPTSGGGTGVAASLNNIGLIHDVLGDYAQALTFHERSLRIKEEIGDKASVAASLNNIGGIHDDLGDYAQALAFHEKSLRVKEEIGDKAGAAVSLSNLCHEKFGAPEERIPFGERALKIAQEIDAPEPIYLAHVALGAAYAAEARSAEQGARSEEGESAVPSSALRVPRSKALRHFRSAISVAESMRSLLSESEHKSGFLGTKLGAYEGLVELLLDEPVVSSQLSVASKRNIPFSGNWPLTTDDSLREAFGVAERMKARSFLDELGAAKFARAGVPEELLEEKRMLEARMKWLRERAQ